MQIPATQINPAVGPGTPGYILLQDQEAANTSGGTATGSAWNTRTLNTEVVDTDGLCSLAADQFTLAAGTYEVYATAPAYRSGAAKLRLRNVTDAATVLVGVSEYSGPTAADTSQTNACLIGRFTIAAAKALELQHYFTNGGVGGGLGNATNATEIEVYAQVELRRVS